MAIRVTLLCVTIFVSPLATASLKTVVALGSIRTEAGLARVECGSHDDGYTRFRGAIIDTGPAEAAYDVILTSGHGLPTDLSELKEHCVVVGGQGQRNGIADVLRPRAQGRGSMDDWAVLLTERRLRGDLKRLRLAQVGYLVRDSMAAKEMPVRLPLIFVEGERECALTDSSLPDFDRSAGLFAHTCRAWPGLSGSPLLIGIGGKAFVLGIHLGRRWVFEEHASVEMGRYVDTTIVEAIEAAAARGRAHDAATAAQQRMRPERMRPGSFVILGR